MDNLLPQIGTITPPDSVPKVEVGQEASEFIAGIIRAGISLLLIVGFVIALIWTIFAGYRFVFSGGDEKSISGATSQIYWGLVGMAIVVGAFAIIKLVETFFNVTIISNGFKIR